MDSSQIAALVMADILQNREFQRHWVDETSEILESMDRIERKREFFQAQEKVGEKRNLNEIEVEMTVGLVAEDCDRATTFFIRGVSLANKIDIPAKFNPDASTLFELTSNLDRLREDGKFNLERWNLIGRRLRKLLANFGSKVCSPFDVVTTWNYASSLCDLLSKFEEYIGIHLSTVKTSSLQRSIDRFNGEVVKTLTRINQRGLKQALTPQRSKGTPTKPSNSSPSFTMVYQKTPSKSSGHLLPADLELARARRRSLSTQKPKEVSRVPQRTTQSAKRPERGAREGKDKQFERECCPKELLQRKYKKLMANEQVLRESIDGNGARTALRMACQLTREVVDEFSKRA